MNKNGAAVFSIEDLSPTELMDLTLFIPEEPIGFRQDETEPGVHGSIAVQIPEFLFSFATIISCLIWLDRQIGRVKLDLSVGIGPAKAKLTITKEEARKALERKSSTGVHLQERKKD